MDPSRITQNLAQVQAQIAETARRSGRESDDVTLVAVTKYVGVAEIDVLVDAGCLDIGESRPQQLWKKAEALSNRSIRWHLVGHLQRNKIKRTLPLVSMLHSVDSRRLLTAVGQEATVCSDSLPVLIEVNISGDGTKHGFSPDQMPSLVAELADVRHLEIRGLMTMAALTGNRSRAQADFARLRKLRDQLRRECPDRITLPDLSMGMSRDYDLAILEGATIVRVGSALFEGGGVGTLRP